MSAGIEHAVLGPAAPQGDQATVTTPAGWFVRVAERPAAVRLYVMPHAGAGPGAVGPLAELLGPEVETWALNLPGRQARLAEPPRTDLGPLVAELAADLRTTPVPYALFGYCGGALLAYLAARDSRPTRLVVGSFAAPDVAVVPRRLHRLSAEMFWDVVLEQGGVPPELAAHAELRPLLEVGLRADFALYAGYHHRRSAPLSVPVTVLHGADDAGLRRGALLGWRRHTDAGLDLQELPSGHWLVDEDPASVAAALLARLAGPEPGTQPGAAEARP